MKVIEHIEKRNNPIFSYEIIPPKRGGNLSDLISVVEDLKKFDPPYIDITSHAAEAIYEETDSGIKRQVKRKRPGTLGLCVLIKHKYGIDAVPHILCRGFTREETEDILIEFHYSGIENVLALRGDDVSYKKPPRIDRTINDYAGDLVDQISSMNQGKYLSNLLDAEKTNFCIGVAGYPEKHYESPNIKTDIDYLKKKVLSGADYIVTQMFYDNNDYFNFVDLCRSEGILVPIIPGIKILSSKNQLSTLPKVFNIDIPYELSEEVRLAKAKHVKDIGVDWAARQVEELLNRDVPAIHFYVMQTSKHVSKLMNKLNI
ncbi:methylenetetrahydrofolate reductase [NAD(P)H] [Candidatus Woesearchaeota archaeon]|jgi:methylenetetrahydrofolate reductase (NADPH)|nr:methylenetetrahydrofolate reductase [NAD(P)H] [Candidatus Woesearchaeota archaeon]MBT6519553.1 methylenetetrahydrofolate reductase [NAD(P)H] [Candidatus Woesearchaeota archaeon]MBT7367702.1 methylenetetrahydrofolate reductase [NAD(P)H] [Candidatus Woesearchaeota archaeon]